MKAFSQAEIWSLIKICIPQNLRQTFDAVFFTKNLLITIQFFYYDFCGIIFDKINLSLKSTKVYILLSISQVFPAHTTKIFGIIHIYVIGEPHPTTSILRSTVPTLYSPCALQSLRSTVPALYSPCALQSLRSRVPALYNPYALQSLRSTVPTLYSPYALQSLRSTVPTLQSPTLYIFT